MSTPADEEAWHDLHRRYAAEDYRGGAGDPAVHSMDATRAHFAEQHEAQWRAVAFELLGCPGVAICRSSVREYRQGYATILLSSVKRHASSLGRIILAYRIEGAGDRRASVVHHEWGHARPRRQQNAVRPSPALIASPF